MRTTTCETYARQCHAQLCDLSSPVRINPHACVRHAPHHVDTLFSGTVIFFFNIFEFEYNYNLQHSKKIYTNLLIHSSLFLQKIC